MLSYLLLTNFDGLQNPSQNRNSLKYGFCKKGQNLFEMPTKHDVFFSQLPAVKKTIIFAVVRSSVNSILWLCYHGLPTPNGS